VKCPKCGSEGEIFQGYIYFACKSLMVDGGDGLSKQGPKCYQIHNSILETQLAAYNFSRLTLYEELELTKKKLLEAQMTCDALNWRMLDHREYITKLEQAARSVVENNGVDGNYYIANVLIKHMEDVLNTRKETNAQQ